MKAGIIYSVMTVKKLIEVSLPLEDINKASVREKSIRHGHPSTLHLWWARRPLAAARAVIFSALVDDPSSHPEKFPTEDEQNAERERLFDILKKLVDWDNVNNREILEAAKNEIMNSTNGQPPELLDPFAGGGSIPLEGQRLGLKVHAHDLNPVAVIINKAMIEIPSRFSGNAPVNPGSRANIGGDTGWDGSSGLAEDVRYYGEMLKQMAFERIGRLYPRVQTPEGERNVIAWLWARTVKCPNPVCGCEIPLANSFILSKKKGHEAWIEPHININTKTITYTVNNGTGKPPEAPKIAKGTFKCIVCGASLSNEYLHEQFTQGKHGRHLMAIVAEGNKGRLYISPDDEHIKTALCGPPKNYPGAEMNTKTADLVSGRGYGFTHWHQLFTNRQLTALTTFSDIIAEIIPMIAGDAQHAGMSGENISLSEGGSGAAAYAQAVGVYLAFAVDKAANLWSNIVSWMNDRGAFRETFSRQAIPMAWDYAEANPFSDTAGNFIQFIQRGVDVISYLPCATQKAKVLQATAQNDCGLRNIMISTDPPYYDNIGFADLSDYFYIWLRKNLQKIYPELFKTVLVPKIEELIATPYRHEGSTARAREFFEAEMLKTCKNLYLYARDDIPVTIYYAYKQSTENENTTLSGWETMLTAIIKAGFAITGTWPIRTESTGRINTHSANALASSIVLVCRKRPADSKQTTRRNFVNELRRELCIALKKLQQSNIAPVDMPQSAIGPGMAVFSKYSRILEADGNIMTVRDALKIINQEVDSYLNGQVGELDNESRFCVELYTQKGFDVIRYGDADNMARAKNISVGALASKGVLYAQKGEVHLTERKELSESAADNDLVWVLAQRLTYAMEKGGIMECAKIVHSVSGMGKTEQAKDLAYRLYTLADRKKWTREAYVYNSLVIAWPEILSEAEYIKYRVPEQQTEISFEENK